MRQIEHNTRVARNLADYTKQNLDEVIPLVTQVLNLCLTWQ